MNSGIQVGNRYLPKNTAINRACGVSHASSLATVCLVKDEQVTVHIDKVKQFYSIEVVMPLAVFAANFTKSGGSMNVANSHQAPNHSQKVYPDYILNLTGNKVEDFA